MALTVVGSALGTGPALAGRAPSGTLTVTPSPARAWGSFHGAGCGYVVGALTTVAVEKPEALAFFNAIPDADGCVSFDAGTDGPGTYGVKVYQLFRNKNTLMGAATLPVQ